MVSIYNLNLFYQYLKNLQTYKIIQPLLYDALLKFEKLYLFHFLHSKKRRANDYLLNVHYKF